jgi:hypothetical protein
VESSSEGSGAGWGTTYLIGAALLGAAARLAASDGSFDLSGQLLGFAGAFLAVGIWSLPMAVNLFIERPGSRFRRFAGAPGVFLRPVLAVAALAPAARICLRVWAQATIVGDGFALVGLLLLGLSTLLVFRSQKNAYAEWRGVGDLVLRVETPTVRRGETVRAVVETSRACRGVTASILLYASDADEDRDYLKTRLPAAVSSIPSADGVFRFVLSAAIAADAPSTLTPPKKDEDESPPWRYWEIEAVAAAQEGATVTRSESFEIEG